jgi:hypothetical protein
VARILGFVVAVLGVLALIKRCADRNSHVEVSEQEAAALFDTLAVPMFGYAVGSDPDDVVWQQTLAAGEPPDYFTVVAECATTIYYYVPGDRSVNAVQTGASGASRGREGAREIDAVDLAVEEGAPLLTAIAGAGVEWNKLPAAAKPIALGAAAIGAAYVAMRHRPPKPEAICDAAAVRDILQRPAAYEERVNEMAREFALFNLTTASRAGADYSAWARTVEAQLDVWEVQLRTLAGMSLSSLSPIGRLGDDEYIEHETVLRTGREYAIAAVCDEDCSDLDLELLRDGSVVASDLEDDDIPLVRYAPGTDGVYTVRVIMARCEREPCLYGVGVYARAR